MRVEEVKAVTMNLNVAPASVAILRRLKKIGFTQYVVVNALMEVLANCKAERIAALIAAGSDLSRIAEVLASIASDLTTTATESRGRGSIQTESPDSPSVPVKPPSARVVRYAAQRKRPRKESA